MEKLTEMRYLYEAHRELIPASEAEEHPEEAEYRVDLIKLRKEVEKIEIMISSQNVIYDASVDICMADFELFFAEFFAERKERGAQEGEPLFLTDVEFSRCVSAFEIKLYQGEPIVQAVGAQESESIRRSEA